MRFKVPEMICGHCRAAIEAAIRARDPQAQVACDLDSHVVEARTTLPRGEVAAVLAEAGYSVTAMDTEDGAPPRRDRPGG